METLETLSDTLETTGDIQSIVRTMKSLAAVSIRQYEQAEDAVSSYEETVNLGLTALLRDGRARGLALSGRDGRAAGGDATRKGLLVIGSDRGLCGRYNEIVARAATDRIGDDLDVLAVVGARAAARLEAEGQQIDRLFMQPGSVAGMTPFVGELIVEIDRWTRERGIGAVSVVHNRREGRARAVPTERALLPISDKDLMGLANAPWRGPGLPFFRMDPPRLLSWLLRQRLFVLLYRALAEALASEHATRLSAMQSAERNIKARREDLMSAYRQKRQETITREMLDVISGFEAVSGSQD